MTWASKIIQVSSTQFYDASSIYCLVCPQPQIKYLSVIIYLNPFIFYYSNSLLMITTILLSVYVFVCLSYLFIYFQIYIPHMSEIIWFLTYSVWLILFNMIFSRFLHDKPGSKGQIPYDITSRWNLINKTNKQAKYNQRHWNKEQTDSNQREVGRG